MTKNSDYWRKRFELLEEKQHQKGVTFYRELEKAYIQAMDAIEKDILKWYNRFATNNEISLDEAKKLLKSDELKEFRWTVDDYIKYGEENAINQQWMKELENASARVHISRLESLRLQLQQHIETLYGGQIEGFERFIKESYQEQYYNTIFEIQKAFNVGFIVQALDEKLLDKVISKPWTADNMTFSARIWRDRNLLINTLHTELTQAIARGEGPDRVISVIQKKMNTSRANAARLVQTEQAFFSAVAQKEAYKKLNVERYEIVATLDTRTSEICREMDGKVFKLSDYEPGVTANPFHPRCRTTTCPYFDDFEEEAKRFSRGIDGRVEYIPSNIKYEDWYQMQLVEYNARQKAKEMIEEAKKHEPTITKDLQETAKKAGFYLKGLEHRLKSEDSLTRKIKNEGNKQIRDVLRYTAIADSENLVKSYFTTIELLKLKGYNETVIKNYWLNPNNPYNGINTFVKSPDGYEFELQYHTEESFELKNGKLHELYEKWRVIDDKSSDEAIKLAKEMAELSSKLKRPKDIDKVR